jgi:hypothetical protein
MSEGKARSERHGDTQEFEALQPPERTFERREFELAGSQQVTAWGEFTHPIELRLGHDEQTPLCYIVWYPSRDSRLNTYAVVQPEVAYERQGQGWCEIDWRTAAKLGREVSPQFRLGPDVSRRHCRVASTNQEEGRIIEIENYSRNGLLVAMHPDDVFREVEPFDPPEGIFD